MNVLSIASLVVSLAALGASVWAVWYARRQAQEAKRANDRADEHDAEQREAARVRWVVEPGYGPRAFVLRQTGTDTVRGVEAWSDSMKFTAGELNRAGDRLVSDVVVPNGGIKFTAVPPSRDVGLGFELLVTWEGQDTPVAVPMPGLVSEQARPSVRHRWAHE